MTSNPTGEPTNDPTNAADPAGTTAAGSTASSDAADSTTASQAERIAQEATNVGERVRTLLLDAIEGRQAALTDLRRTADAVLAGVSNGVQSAGANDREGVLNEAISGIADGVSRTVNATRLAMREAEGRGQRFAEEDLKQTVEDLRTIEQLFEGTLSRFIDRATTEAKAQADDVRSHAENTAKGAKADITATIEAVTQHPQKLAKEATGAASDAAKQGVGALFQVASGLLDAAADVAANAAKTDRK
ncbi:MAG: DUF6781 family protein [Planctomycetota bacterium]